MLDLSWLDSIFLSAQASIIFIHIWIACKFFVLGMLRIFQIIHQIFDV